MPSLYPPQSAIDAFFAPTTRHTRRVEIYEADGVTRWVGDTEIRLMGGSISVDYGRDERRSLELILSNDDAGLEIRPGELWYDKVIKVFRGVTIGEADTLPRVLIIADPAGPESCAVAFRAALVELGYDSVRINTDASSYSLDVAPYDIIVGLGGATDQADLLAQAIGEGKTVFATSESADGLLTDLYGYSPLVEPVVGIVAPNPSVPHPVARGWTGFQVASNGNGVLAPSSLNNYTSIADQNTSYSIIGAITHASGGRAVVVNYPVDVNQFDSSQFKAFMLSAFDWLNIKIGLEYWETQIGEFIIDRFVEDGYPRQVGITARDYSKKCLLSKFTFATQFDAGTPLESIIASIAGAAGITKRILPTTGITVGRDFFFERGVTRWEAMKEISNSYNYELFFDAQGYLVMREYADPATGVPSLYVRTGPDGIVASYRKSSSDTRIFNHILVTGESSDSTVPPVYAEALNNDPDSPTRIEKLGDRVFEYSSSFIQTTQQAIDVATSFLAIYSLEEYELSLETLLLIWLDAGDIIGWVDPDPATDDPSVFMLYSMNIPLGLGPMSSVARRVSIVGESNG